MENAGRVPNDQLENPAIVPIKVLKGHKVVSNLGVLDIGWHPSEAWCVSAGADGTAHLQIQWGQGSDW